MWAFDKEFCLPSLIHQGSMKIRGLKPIASHLKFISRLTGLHMLSLTFIKLGCEQKACQNPPRVVAPIEEEEGDVNKTIF
jgi:hypothetical protein